MIIDIGIITKINYIDTRTILSCQTGKDIIENVLLYEIGGIKTQIAIGNKVIIFRYSDWALESQLLAFHIGEIEKIKILANKVNLIKQISLSIGSVLLSSQYNIDAHNANLAVLTALEGSNLDAPTKAIITTQKAILQTKITSLTNEKSTLQNIKTEIDKTFFE